MSNKVLLLLLFLLFAVSRLYIISFPPYDTQRRPNSSYSDVKQDYERYANMWYYGLTPYLEHYYEYPPATIPLVSTPLILDQNGIGKYYDNYRKQILVIDFLLFLTVLAALKKLKTSRIVKTVGFTYFLVAPMIAKDFFYEGIDLTFITALTAGIVSLFLFSQKKLLQRVLFWGFFWLSTAIKFMSAPLLLPFFWLKQLSFKKEIVACILGFILIWGLPLVLYRSSLSVSFVFHANRPFKYGSFPAYLIDTVNRFTNTEHRIDKPPDNPYVGPVSTAVERIDALAFPLSLLAVALYGVLLIIRHTPKDKLSLLIRRLLFIQKIDTSHLDPFAFSLKMTFILVFVLFVTGRVFSAPFHIWYIPLIALYPFTNLKQQLIFVALTLWILIVDTTAWIRIPDTAFVVGPLNTWSFLHFTRFFAMFILLGLSLKLSHHSKLSQQPVIE